jgi:hypothetical protein
MSFLDLSKKGPMVVDAATGSYGAFFDLWQQTIAVTGPTGADKGDKPNHQHGAAIPESVRSLLSNCGKSKKRWSFEKRAGSVAQRLYIGLLVQQCCHFAAASSPVTQFAATKPPAVIERLRRSRGVVGSSRFS